MSQKKPYLGFGLGLRTEHYETILEEKPALTAIPSDRIYQIHLAGHSDMGDYMIDTHDNDIIDPVWDLYAETLRHHGAISTMIERDDNIPPLSELLTELNRAKEIAKAIIARRIRILKRKPYEQIIRRGNKISKLLITLKSRHF
jgi:uncharacterized protein (UPF0276 family)